jgi:hypothetical protein
MATRREEFQTLLEGLLGTDKVYFQPPTNVTMVYPAIVYNRDYRAVQFADNTPYFGMTRYQVTVIDRDPDSLVPDKVAMLPMTTMVRHFVADGLNHDIYDVYF